MSKSAGMFAGEVTPLAPADGSPTTKHKSYVWMEYGNLVDTGICGTSLLLNPGQLLSVAGISQILDAAQIEETSPLLNGVSFDDTTVISFTFAFTRANSPDSGKSVHIIDIYNTTNLSSSLEVFMDSDGYINFIGRNSAGTTILDLEVTNAGATFAGGDLYFFAGVINLTDTANRELYINNVDVGEDATYTTWNTYTNDTLALADPGSPNIIKYAFSFSYANLVHWSDNTPGYNSVHSDDMIGYLSFDDHCSLVSQAVWDDSGWVRDPQAWEGWYLAQPQCFYGPTFYKNTGKTKPEYAGQNDMEASFGLYYGSVTNMPAQEGVVNLGVGGTTEAV